MELLVIAILLIVSGAQQYRMEGPQNTMSILGSRVTLKCSTPSGNCRGVHWQKSHGSNNTETVFSDQNGISNTYRDRYNVDSSSGCDLVINDVKLTDAGSYTCGGFISASTFQMSAHLKVLSAHQGRMERPQNTLGIVGTNVTLTCSISTGNCSDIDWEKSSLQNYPETNIRTIFTKGGILQPYQDRYSVNTSSGCDLVINDVKLTDDGRFTCRVYMTGRTYERDAYLVVFKTKPKCAINASLNDTVERDRVQLTCEVTYNGTDNVSMLWKDVENAPGLVENEEIISRSYSLIASAPEVPSFKCVNSLEIRLDKDSALNFSTTACETPAIKVLYSVRNVTLSPSFSYYSPGTIITCEAKGHPSPNFKWQVRESGKEGIWMDIPNQNRREFTPSNVTSRLYRCVAMNVVRGRNYSANSSEFQVNNPDESTSVHPLAAYLPLVVPIAAGVAVGILVLLILLIVCFCVRSCLGYRCCHSEKNSKADNAQPVKHRKSSSSNQNSSIPNTEAVSCGQQESTYESLGYDRDTNAYESLEQR